MKGELAEQVLAYLRVLHRLRVPWGPRELPPPRRFGRYAERVAASWLRAQGYRILRTNWRWGRSGELDIVSREGDALVITEVKSALGTRGGAPARHVNRRKRELLRHGANNWLRLLNRPVPVRFDIIEVYLPAGEIPEIERLENAFPLKGK
ncbi:MAG: YraN family protein [Akkermansia sp.]|nr:YraN family protein [Akkermansia sp.]